MTEPEASDLEGHYWMPQREQQNASSSSGRKESQNLNAQASGDRLHSKGDDDMINLLLSLGVNIIPNLVTTVEEPSRNLAESKV